jgi:hypothetical protein
MPDVPLPQNATGTMHHIVRGEAGGLIDDENGIHERSK